MRNVGGEQKHLARLKHQHFALVRGIDVVEIELAFELIENFIAFVDVELFAAIGAAVNDRDEVRVLPDVLAPASISSVLFNPMLKIEFAQMWKHLCALPSCAKSLLPPWLFSQSPIRV